ncbi:MAG: hydrogenase expression/formation protein HypE [Candidatus Methanofastidiosa archaeon]|nr:hydrogenase expression/formation protein HypE [Candidatus Methanofastidiosa archaeon]
MKITSKDGAGGRKMQEFLKDVILDIFGPSSVGCIGLDSLDDGASFGEDYIISTDGHTVKPVFFKGGDIGRLAACGTINDVSVMGAKPLLLTSSLIIQSGFDLEDLRTIMRSMKDACDEVDTSLVAGDTKVVDDNIGIYISTTGVGERWKGLDRNMEIVRETREYEESFVKDGGLMPGDKIISSGTIGDHGISIMAQREGINLFGDLRSDVCPVWDVTKRALAEGGVTAMKDPTRGGISAALNEMAEKSHCGIVIEEGLIPTKRPIVAAAEMLGINIHDVANEGKVVIGVRGDLAEDVLEAIRDSKYATDASIIGEAIEGKRVFLKTRIGARRLMNTPDGDPVPRVC